MNDLNKLSDRELDRIAAEVFFPDRWSPFEPSTNIADAFELVEKMKQQGYLICLNTASERNKGVLNGLINIGDWHCGVRKNDESYHVYAKTAPRAITIAAILAKRGEKE